MTSCSVPGPGPPPQQPNLVSELAKGCQKLQPPELDADGAEQGLMDAAGQLPKFERDAFDGIRRAAPPSATVRESVRRALSRKADS